MDVKFYLILGISLILIGIAVCAGWIGIFALDLYEKWRTNVAFQSGQFGTFWDHFWAVGKVHVVLAAAGCIPAIAGVCQLRKREG